MILSLRRSGVWDEYLIKTSLGETNDVMIHFGFETQIRTSGSWNEDGGNLMCLHENW